MFCNKCGSELNSEDLFCSKCGNDVSSISDEHSETDEVYESVVSDMPVNHNSSRIVFSSKLLLGGNIIRPDRLIIAENNVVYEKRNKYLIGKDRIMIPFSRIASVEIDRKLISSRIIIYSKGDQSITVENFSISAGRRIKEEIEKRM